ncbi:MAG: KH domain-containing protein [Pyrinomonadaceae bacterium]
MRDTIEMIVKALVSDGEAVEVHQEERDRAIVIEVRVAQSDMGKLIGRQGRTVKALRTLLGAAGHKQNRRYVLDLVE